LILRRIISTKYALDKLCEGARAYGGGWNPMGFPVMYASTTIEICALEKFVHLAGSAYPPLRIASIEISTQ